MQIDDVHVAARYANRKIYVRYADTNFQKRDSAVVAKYSDPPDCRPDFLPGPQLLLVGRTGRKVRVQGLEPWTYGLKVRCSTD